MKRLFILAIAAMFANGVGCSEQKLPTIPEDPAIERIFFTTASGSYFTVRSVKSDGKNARPLLEGKGYIASTPHHYRIAAVHPLLYSGNAIVKSVLRTATTSAKNLTEIALDNERPITCTISFDGEKISFTTLEGSLYIANLDGSERKRLSDSVVPEIPPAFSPDSKRLVFIAQKAQGYSLNAINADGSVRIELADNADAASQSQPAWAPGGIVILFVGRDASNIPQLYVVDEKGNKLIPVTTGVEPKSNPVWSPNGYKIAYTQAMPPNGIRDIFICNSDGSNPGNITNTPTDNEYYPHWSPEGTRLLFTANESPSASLCLLDTVSKTTTTIANNIYGRGFWDYSLK